MSHLVCARALAQDAAATAAMNAFRAFMEILLWVSGEANKGGGACQNVQMNADMFSGERVVRTITVIFLASLAFPGIAHEHAEQWALANEYPATSLPGEGDAHFAKLVADKTAGKISIVAMP